MCVLITKHVIDSIVALEKNKEKQLEEGNTIAIEKGKKFSCQYSPLGLSSCVFSI